MLVLKDIQLGLLQVAVYFYFQCCRSYKKVTLLTNYFFGKVYDNVQYSATLTKV